METQVTAAVCCIAQPPRSVTNQNNTPRHRCIRPDVGHQSSFAQITWPEVEGANTSSPE